MKNFLLSIIITFSTFTFSQSTVGSVTNLLDANNSNCVLDIDNWSYIVFTKDINNEGKLYKNGQLIYSGTWANINYSWSRLDLGAVFYTSYNGWFNGLIDEVRISNTIRTPTEILNYFNSNLPFSSDSNTIGLWHLDEENNSTITASTGVNGSGFNITSSEGKFGNSYSFNGVNSRIQINQSIPTTNLTVEFWIKPQGINNDVWPVNMYGLNTSGFVINQVNLNSEEFLHSKNNISVYPNPTNSDFYIKINNNLNLNDIIVKITNVLGQQVYSTTMRDSQLVSLQGNIRGVYFVSLYSIKDEKLIRSFKILFQ